AWPAASKAAGPASLRPRARASPTSRTRPGIAPRAASRDSPPDGCEAATLRSRDRLHRRSRSRRPARIEEGAPVGAHPPAPGNIDSSAWSRGSAGGSTIRHGTRRSESHPIWARIASPPPSVVRVPPWRASVGEAVRREAPWVEPIKARGPKNSLPSPGPLPKQLSSERLLVRILDLAPGRVDRRDRTAAVLDAHQRDAIGARGESAAIPGNDERIASSGAVRSALDAERLVVPDFL